MPAYYAETVPRFLSASPSEITQALHAGYSSDNFNFLYTAALDAWGEEIQVLREQLSDGDLSSAGLLLEFWIPRRLKRADAILLMRDLIVVLEFKLGKEPSGAKRQVEDYALDLRDFHELSHNRRLVPVVVTEKHREVALCDQDQIQPTNFIPPMELGTFLSSLTSTLPRTQPDIDLQEWNNGQYQPVPTVLEAARAMFAGMKVEDIARCDADTQNLTSTIEKLTETILWAKDTNQKIVCFVTGVPGAGKTLAGLRLVHDAAIAEACNSQITFLSGNGPLVKILQSALKEDQADREQLNLHVAQRSPETLIQGVYSFKRTHWNDSKPPNERVIVFDEAQRAWNQKKTAKSLKKEDFPHSEPGLILEIMGRHNDWTVVVALIGGGQEIHDGEAGLQEWGASILTAGQPWTVVTSPQALNGGEATAHTRLFENGYGGLEVHEELSFHLDNPTRQYRGKTVCEWTNATLRGDKSGARAALASSPDYPVHLTRSLEVARDWLRGRGRGSERFGLVASSGAGRLRPYGIETSNTFHKGIPIHHWFLRGREDFRSSFKLEVATTEFEIQGLELDWVGICWGGDMLQTPLQSGWDLRTLDGPKWRSTTNPIDRKYTVNSYRVLLTRARQGMVIFVPPGDSEDSTLPPQDYDATAAFLRACGVQELP